MADGGDASARRKTHWREGHYDEEIWRSTTEQGFIATWRGVSLAGVEVVKHRDLLDERP